MASKVPKFGAWESGEKFTDTFDSVRRTKNNGETRPKTQPGPAIPKPQTREGRSKVPQFGGWESEGGDDYTAAFDNLTKKNDPNSKAPRDVGRTPQEGLAEVPQLEDSDLGEVVRYTAYIDPKKSKNSRTPGMNSTEPQLNKVVGETKPRVESKEDGLRNASRGKQSSVAKAPLHQKERVQTRPVPSRVNQAGSVPQFGGWHTNPSQAEGYTTAFALSKEERKTPLHNNVPSSYHQQTRLSNQQPSCCSIL